MLHAKFQDHRTSGSGDGDFNVFTIYGHGRHFGHVTWTIYINCGPPFSNMLHIKFGFDQRRRSLKMVDNARRTDAGSIGKL